MLSLPPTVRVYIAPGPTDMRKAIDGLAAVTQQIFERDPLSGHLFVFCNRRRDRIKILYWESSGYWLLHKRLERGTFSWPQRTKDAVEMTATELAALLGGIEIHTAKKRRWYSRQNETMRASSTSA